MVACIFPYPKISNDLVDFFVFNLDSNSFTELAATIQFTKRNALHLLSYYNQSQHLGLMGSIHPSIHPGA